MLRRYVTAAILLVFVAVGLLASGGCASQPTLIIATSEDYPPFSYRDDQGNLAGLDYQYGKLLCQELKVRCEWRSDAFAEVFNQTIQGQYDLVINSFTRTAVREALVLFSDPYYKSYGQFVRRAGDDADLSGAGTVVAVQSQTIYERYLNLPRFDLLTIVVYPNQEDAFRAVAQGQADLTIADDVLTDLAVNRSPFLWGGQVGDFERVGAPIVPAPGTPEFDALGAGEIGIILPKSNVELLPEVNRAIREINSGSVMAEISRGYFGRNILNTDW